MVSARNIFAFVVMTQMSLVFAHSHDYRNITSPNGDFMLQWKHNNSASKLMFKITCNGTGWCGVGFTETADGKNMVNYDIAVGGFASMGYVKDYWSTGKIAPKLDAPAQDFMLTSASEADGKTVVEFTRNYTTNNSTNDVQFMADKMVWVVWAYHKTMDADTSLTAQHTDRGIFGMKYNLIMADTPITEPPTTYERSMKSPDGDFMLEWTHNVGASKLMFKITCKGTGWCGVGFTETADGKGMKDYDIAVGGYANSAGYVKDYWSKSTTAPTLDDPAQDFMLTGASEADGKTVVEFTRNDTTSNSMNDVQFTADTMVWVVWAYHKTMDVDTSLTAYHNTDRGISDKKYNLIMADTPPTDSASIVGPSFVFCMLLVFKELFFSE